MFNAILVVCTGNICRSPLGERLLRRHFPKKKIDSAGLDALIGLPADLMAAKAAAQRDLSLAGHNSQQFTPQLAQQYELILVMENHHQNQITQLAPEASGKTMLYGHWIEQEQIPDPYRKGQQAFEHVYLLLEQAAEMWATKLDA